MKSSKHHQPMHNLDSVASVVVVSIPTLIRNTWRFVRKCLWTNANLSAAKNREVKAKIKSNYESSYYLINNGIKHFNMKEDHKTIVLFYGNLFCWFWNAHLQTFSKMFFFNAIPGLCFWVIALLSLCSGLTIFEGHTSTSTLLK